MNKLVAVLLGAVVTGAISFGVVAAGAPTTGSGGVDFPVSLVPGTNPITGIAGRTATLTGAIQGTNYEPGICNPFPAGTTIPTPGGPLDVSGKCLIFTNTEPVPPGHFKRTHNGQTAFTTCVNCTIDGKTGTFDLKITYPNPKNIQTTHFTIQNATGGLAGLQGQGTLDFATGAYTLRYHFQ